MFALSSADADEGGWRHDPRVAMVAGAIILLALIVYSCRSCRRRGPKPPPEVAEAKAVMRYCLNCKKAFPVTRDDVRKIAGDMPDSIKAREVPCPHCGKTGTTEALKCQHCGQWFSPVSADGQPLTTCPHCGEDPYRP